MRNRAVDIVIGLLLASCGLLIARNGYAALKIAEFFGGSPWEVCAPLVLGSAVIVVALGLPFYRRLSGLVGSILMLVMVVLFIPPTIDEKTILLLWDDTSVEFASYLSPAVFLIMGVFVCWRFVLAPRAKTQTI